MTVPFHPSSPRRTRNRTEVTLFHDFREENANRLEFRRGEKDPSMTVNTRENQQFGTPTFECLFTGKYRLLCDTYTY